MKNKTPFVPLAQPKKTISPRLKFLNRKANDFKKEMGMKGKIKEGDLINKSRSLKEKISVMGLV